ncbi:ATP-dependent helicase [Novosphingobium sp.]|uniref:ATP-dependent helicase n=1 Tax=Novosphingobium sp. TaxID=1874826 RepID=UPI002FE19E54
MIRPTDWKPIGVASLEEAALLAVKSMGSALVAASPGTGKTELLGQRAAYLLQTGICPFPRRILAISFKRDAASNLRDRVARRSGPEAARQLDSMTFDAFAKQLLDRFWRALPSRWALGNAYRIGPIYPSRQGFPEFRYSVANSLTNGAQPTGWAAGFFTRPPAANDIQSASYDDYNHGIQRLVLEPLTVPTVGAFLQLVALRRGLISTPPTFSFGQIGCLATAIIAANPAIRDALRATYSHVFLDEFQDTTSVQYGLVQAIFAGSDCVLTAVGDVKQRIMGWAGAQRDVFEAFESDFLSKPGALGRLTLTRNYRSNDRIVRILNILKRRIAPDEPDFVALRQAPALPDSEIFALMVASDQDVEARGVAEIVAKAIKEGADPRSIGLLVRQRAPEWEDRLREAFEAANVSYRNEDRDVGGGSIQDLMTEIYSRAVLDLVEFATRTHGGPLWSIAMGHFAAAQGIEIDDDESAERALAVRVDAFHRANRLDPEVQPEEAEVRRVVATIEEALGLDRLRGLAPQYATGEFFENIRKATVEFLVECAGATGSWRGAIDRYRGNGQVPLLTITKSKGLEYDLVVLLGLNDDEWWSFDRDVEEGHSLFFVAASRARERLVLTRCASDRRSKIDEIFTLLAEAGVTERRV